MASDGMARELFEAVRKQGWRITRTGGNHWCFRSPNGHQIYASSTPSDRRALANLRSQLRRAGAVV